MKINELVGEIAKNNPKTFVGVSERKAAAIVRAAFEYIAEAVENSVDDVVKVPGLGQFRARQTEREVNGKKVAKKVVVYRSGKLKSKNVGGKDK